MASFPGQPGKLVSERQNKSGFKTRQEMMGFWYGSGISRTIRKQSAPHSGQITTRTPYHSIFYRSDALSDAQPTVSKQSTGGKSVNKNRRK